MNQLSAWAKEPTRVIHWVVAAAVIVAAIAGDLANALNGTETWVGAAIAVANVAQGEINRSQVRPVRRSIPDPTGMSSLP